MSLPIDPQRPFRIVTAVLAEALRSTGRAAFVVSGGGPEEALLLEWLDRALLPWQRPSPQSLESARALLADIGHEEQLATAPHLGMEPARDLEAAASALSGAALAGAKGLLHLGTTNKTCLLLSPRTPLQPVLPLGDLYASQILVLAGSCTVPPCLQGMPSDTLEGVDAGLKAYLEDGFHHLDALARLPERVRREVMEALAMARREWHPIPLIPKLAKATLGLDLDL